MAMLLQLTASGRLEAGLCAALQAFARQVILLLKSKALTRKDFFPSFPRQHLTAKKESL